MKNKILLRKLLNIKDNLYSKSFLCGFPIYINSCFARSEDDSYHFEIVVREICTEFMNYLYDFANVTDIIPDNGFIKIKVVFS